MVVGTHFYQTNPEFIEAFLDCSNVRFVWNPDGVFHPKVYLFEKPTGEWECLVGSPNFTHGGMDSNDEITVVVTDSDHGGQEALSSFKAAIEGYWEKARPLTQGDLVAYRAAWKRKQPIRMNLQGKFGNPHKDNSDDKGRYPLGSDILRMPWAEFFDKVQAEKITQIDHSMEARLKVIEVAKQLFAKHVHFNSIDRDGRRSIAGLSGVVGDVDYGLFGSMTGAGMFKQAVNGNSEQLSIALDAIPTGGYVSREMFLEYVEQCKRAFPKGGLDVATASRLLAMKRPDVFVCLDSKNKTGLCKAFGIKGAVGYEKYWDSIVKRIMEATWWNSPPPASEIERQVWAARAAFLDSHYYDERG
jgi:hypothetical protein